MDQSTIIIIISFSIILVLAILVLALAVCHRTCSSKRKLSKSNNARDWKYDAEVNEDRFLFTDPPAAPPANAADVAKPPRLHKKDRRKTVVDMENESRKSIRYYDLNGSETEVPMTRLPPPSLWGR